MTQETEGEMIKRRSQNADAAMGCLIGFSFLYDLMWIFLGLALLAAWFLLA